MPRTYHIVPAERWVSADPGRPYEAASLVEAGFVHCTDGREELLATANRHLADDPRPFLVLTLELDKVASPWRYDVPDSLYPHIYGPIDRGAIVRVTPLERDADGHFVHFEG